MHRLPFSGICIKKHEGNTQEGETGERDDGTWVGVGFLDVYLFIQFRYLSHVNIHSNIIIQKKPLI